MKKIDKKEQIKILKILLILVWMITVFMFSAQKGEESGNTSGRFTELIVHILTGKSVDSNSSTIQILETIIRKLAHYSIYTIGGFLVMNYAYTTNKTIKEKILYSICFGGSYAITDELHQFFVPDRSARLFDVGIDTLGVITGVLIYLILRKCLEKIIHKHRMKFV